MPVVGGAGTTDLANYTLAKKKFDVVAFGPGEPLCLHQISEYVEIDSYLNWVQYYKQIALDYLK